jgi:hypothetical protein
MKRFDEFVNERYKETEITSIEDVFNIESTFVDKVFDHLVQIVCDVHHISEKSFKQWDETTDYIRSYFDNNPDILQDIDKFKNRRYEFCAEYLFDKHFSNENKDNMEINLVADTNAIDQSK